MYSLVYTKYHKNTICIIVVTSKCINTKKYWCTGHCGLIPRRNLKVLRNSNKPKTCFGFSAAHAHGGEMKIALQ